MNSKMGMSAGKIIVIKTLDKMYMLPVNIGIPAWYQSPTRWQYAALTPCTLNLTL